MASITHISQKLRIAISRVFGIAIVLLVIFSGPSFTINVWANAALDLFCFALILTATFGRLWALAYISGHKTRDLISDGPYSMVRNPLYLFSLIGALGIALVSKNILVIALIIILFCIYYPFVIRGEEKHLQEVHGKAFEDYKKKTPMFLPSSSAFTEQPFYSFDTRLFRKAFFSVMWFPIIFMLMLLVERFHLAGILPVFLRIP